MINVVLFSLFTKEEVEEINSTTLHDIIVQVTGIGASDIQENPFVWLDGKHYELVHFTVYILHLYKHVFTHATNAESIPL